MPAKYAYRVIAQRLTARGPKPLASATVWAINPIAAVAVAPQIEELPRGREIAYSAEHLPEKGRKR